MWNIMRIMMNLEYDICLEKCKFLLWLNQEMSLIIQIIQHLISYLIYSVIRTIKITGKYQKGGRTFQTTDANKEQHSAKTYLHKCFSAWMASAEDKSLFL